MVLIDYEKTPVQNLLDLINASSSVVFEETHLTFGTPVEIVSALPGNPNTSIIITATEDSLVAGTTPRKYRRIDIGEDFVDYLDVFEFSTGTSESTMLQYLIDQYDLHPDSTFTLTSALNNKKSFKPTAADLLYCGERLVTITLI